MKPQDKYDEYFVEFKNNEDKFGSRFTTFYEDSAIEFYNDKCKEYDYVELFGREWNEVSLEKRLAVK